MNARTIEAEAVPERRGTCCTWGAINRLQKRRRKGIYRCGVCRTALPNKFRIGLWLGWVVRIALAISLGSLSLFIAAIWLKPSWSSFAFLAALVAVVGVLASLEEGVSVGNGFGTTLRGEHRTADGYIATKWVVFYYAPLIPIRSCEIVGARDREYLNWWIGASSGPTLRYRPLSTGLLYWPQVAPTFALVWAIICIPALLHAL